MLSQAAEMALLVLRQQHEQLLYVAPKIVGVVFEAVFRPMTLAESKAVGSVGMSIPPCVINEWIVKSCLLFLSRDGEKVLEPVDYISSDAPAGLADVIAHHSMVSSGFDDPANFTTLLSEARSRVDSLEMTTESFICAAFPGTRPVDVQNMTLYQQMNMLARAEAILGRKIELQGEQTKKGKRLSPEAAAILSREAADMPDPAKDNAYLDQFLTGRERMGVP